jgi:signal transduction histidine kinase
MAMSIVQFVLPLALSILFVLLVGLAFTRRQRNATAGESVELIPDDATAPVDLEVAVRAAIASVAAMARLRQVRIELAVGTTATIPVSPGVLRTALHDIMLTAIDAAPGGRMLVTAGTCGDQVHIRITDDSRTADRQGRETSTWQTGVAIAAQGGSVAVEARPGEGTTVTIELPTEVSAERADDGLAQQRVLEAAVA